MKIFNLILLVALAIPAFSQDQGTYKGTLGPVESVKLTFQPDHRIKIEHEVNLDKPQVDIAVGEYQWNGNHLEIQIDEVRTNQAQEQSFTLEIRRKGIDAIPKVEIKNGASLDFVTELHKDRLTLNGPDGWQLPLYRTP
jgi:hypothetical protein